MTILVDLNQIIYSTISIEPRDKNQKLDEDLIRHITLNRLRTFRTKFKSKYGELIICADSRHYWRRDVFPNYKVMRKHTRESSGLPWEIIFAAMNNIKAELKETFPYKFIEVEGAEADDLIAILAKYINESTNEKVLIISGDKDFKQLHSANIQQWDPASKGFVQTDNVQEFLLNHILRGDKGDSIPNIKSTDDFFIAKISNPKLRAPKITRSFVASFNKETCGQEQLRNYHRNAQLIDLTQIPKDIKLNIIEEYKTPITGHRSKLFNYFIKHNLKYLMDTIQEF